MNLDLFRLHLFGLGIVSRGGKKFDIYSPPPYTNRMDHPGKAFEKLIDILATLRGPNGCPWDKEQTYQDINPYLLEEAHEVVESIDRQDFEGLQEELGDLLMHILFHSQMAREERHFDIQNVIESISEKLVRRHPHVFGETKVENSREVLANWEQIKQQERKEKGEERKSLLDGIPKGVPALIKAFRMGEKTSRVGFDWNHLQGILAKLKEEWQELEEAIQKGGTSAIEKEYGDLLFTLANVGRFLKLDPETSLRKAAHSFQKRFEWMEQQTLQTGKAMQDLTAEEWDRLWETAKEKIIQTGEK